MSEKTKQELLQNWEHLTPDWKEFLLESKLVSKEDLARGGISERGEASKDILNQ